MNEFSLLFPLILAALCAAKQPFNYERDLSFIQPEINDLSDPLTYFVDVAGVTNFSYENTIYRDGVTSAQLLFSSSNSTSMIQRFIAAFPQGNSGALMYFLNSDDSQATFNNTVQQPNGRLAVKLVNNSLASARGDYNMNGIRGSMTFNNNASLGVTILGSVRAIRDYAEGYYHMDPIFNYTLVNYSSSQVTLRRAWINGTFNMIVTLTSSDTSKLTFDAYPPATSLSPVICNFILGNGVTMATVDFLVLFNESSIGPGIDKKHLFLPAPNVSISALDQALTDLYNDQTNGLPATEVTFLTHTSKFLAGGWRFLTYFGRDDMYSLRLFMALLQPEAIEAAFSGVLERLYLNGSNTYSKEQVFEGEVCHEETIGDYSSYININNGRGDLGGAPYYAYSMIDTDLLLLPSLAHYFLELPQGKDRAYWFLMRTSSLDTTKGRTYYDLLHLNVKFVMDTSQPFADNPSVDNLRHLKPGEPVGSWRDSSTGLGNGRIPFDVNVGLVPGCLRAIASLAKAGILDKSLEDTANRYATVWEQRASGFFEVKMPIEQAFSHILNYTQWANLTADLNYGEGAFNDSSFAVQGAAPTAPNTAHGWLSNDDTDHMFYALSLFNDSTPVQTLHSDIGAPLLYANNISERYMKAIADALLPFPKGLLTPIGPVVANPAMDANINDYSLFDRAQYHGSVVWGFQNAILASGLIRQLSFCGSYLDSSLPFVDVYTQPAAIPPWCMNKELVGALLAGLDRLWRGFEGAGKNIYSEVWSYSYINKKFVLTNLADLSVGGTEGDAIQLWSYGFLALINPRNGINSTLSSTTLSLTTSSSTTLSSIATSSTTLSSIATSSTTLSSIATSSITSSSIASSSITSSSIASSSITSIPTSHSSSPVSICIPSFKSVIYLVSFIYLFIRFAYL